MYSFERTIPKACKRCGQPFEAKQPREFYCGPCKPIALKTAQDRAAQKRAKRRAGQEKERRTTEKG